MAGLKGAEVGGLGLEDWAGWLGPMAGLMGWVCSEGLGAGKTLVPKKKLARV